MKTLDEVINKLECYPVSPSTLPCSVSIVTVEDLNDALYYLKAYRKKGYSWLKEEMRLRKAIDSLLVALKVVKCILHGDDDENA